jgi:hypothetical protein
MEKTMEWVFVFAFALFAFIGWLFVRFLDIPNDAWDDPDDE